MSLDEVGALLKQTREENKYKLQDASKALNIRLRYLEALEKGDISEIESEIYVIGYLKSYAHWLGLDSEEIVSNLKAQNDNSSPIGAKLPTTAPLFVSSTTDVALKPSVAVLALSVALTVGVYVFWYESRKNDAEVALYIPQTDAVVTGDTLTSGGAGVQPQADGRHFVLLAHEKVSLTIIDDRGQEAAIHAMEAGDMFFMSKSKGSAIKADKPEAVEVFTDDEAGTFLGALAPFMTLDELHKKADQALLAP